MDQGEAFTIKVFFYQILSPEGGKKAVLAFFASCETAKGSERALKDTKGSRRLPGGRQACSTGIYSQQV